MTLPPPIVLFAACALAALAGACTPSPVLQERISGACETMKCACVILQNSIFGEDRYRPVHYKIDGAAYCPEGQVLTVVESSSPFYVDPIPPNYYVGGGAPSPYIPPPVPADYPQAGPLNNN